jgi:DnaJ-class molecular chaperone
MEENEQNYYEILGISQTATLEEIKKAFRKKCMEYHPDINHNANNEECHEMMCKINEAYRILKDPESRMRYDQMLIFLNKKSNHHEEPQEPQSNNNKYDYTEGKHQSSQVNRSTYNYYNSIDFDEETQTEFVSWMEEFFDEYFNYLYTYNKYHKQNKRNYDAFEKLCILFEDILCSEKRQSINKEKNTERANKL